MKTRFYPVLLTLAAALWLLQAGSAAALPIGNYTMSLSIDGVEVGSMSQVVDPDYGDTGYYHLDDLTLGGGIAFLDYWTSNYDIDPFVTNNFSVSNLTAFTQTYDITVTLPVVPTGPQTTMTGSVGLTVTNTNSASATVDDSGVPVYRALIDGGVAQTLLNSPGFLLTCGTPFCSNTTSASFTNVLGPAATTDIAIRLRFTLSPGDSASGTSVFNIEAVPEPGTLLLLAGGLVGVAHFGRRRA